MRDLVSIVLASASPRRYELLTSLGLDVVVMPSGLMEGDRPGHTPQSLAVYYAAAKADAVFARTPGETVVAADTVVDLAGQALGKPRDAAEARAMLEALAGRDHFVHTAYSIRSPGGTLDGLGTSRVWFAPRDDAATRSVRRGRRTVRQSGRLRGAGPGRSAGRAHRRRFLHRDGLPTGRLHPPPAGVGTALAGAATPSEAISV